MALVKVLRESELEEGKVRGVVAGKERLAVARIGGKVYCFDNTCAHKGGPLGDGTVDDGQIRCPWHAYRYNAATGQCSTDPSLKISTYKVVLKDGEIFVEL
jgi:nitrite reductase/ring-hydroxylating ferredoxin subunit